MPRFRLLLESGLLTLMPSCALLLRPHFLICRPWRRRCPTVSWRHRTVLSIFKALIQVRCRPICWSDLGCQFVLVGHSERRQYHDETDALIAEKLAAAQSAGVTPILCVGEQQAAREAGKQDEVVRAQLRSALATAQPNLLIAYEPVWAIGTGLTATPDQANEMHEMIRQEVSSLLGASHATPILYGGSVNAENADALFACPHVDGALVGGASLQAASFMAIAQSASNNLSH
jgi:triosephosphate isomerase